MELAVGEGAVKLRGGIDFGAGSGCTNGLALEVFVRVSGGAGGEVGGVGIHALGGGRLLIRCQYIYQRTGQMKN